MNQPNPTAEPTLYLGKFKDAAALEQAYRALEAEFTKRCQRLRALELQAQRQTMQAAAAEEIAAATAAAVPAPAPAPVPVAVDPTAILDDPAVFELLLDDERLHSAVIARYLSALQKAAAPPTMGGSAGAIALTPALRPKTLAECKQLADRYL